MKQHFLTLLTLVFFLVFTDAVIAQTNDPLPSWNDNTSKQSIIQFVKDVTTAGGSKFVPLVERIAVFDNDGTLWVEKPIYVQLAFAFDRLKEIVAIHPELKEKQPFKAGFEGEYKTFLTTDKNKLFEIMMATHAGNTTEEFAQVVKNWLVTARHPNSGQLYTDMVYQPMLEVLNYLRNKGFKTYIVSGGGIEFMRPWTERVYGVPPEQVIGSSIKTEYELRDGKPVLVRLPEINFINDKAGKPVGINQHIGRRPIAVFGNSDGDLQMFQWTTSGNGARFALLVHHTDDVREWAYDRESYIGRLDKALDEAKAKGWTVVDMKDDWKIIFPFEKR